MFFIITSGIFSIANYAALKNNVFVFTKPDLFLMPFNEVLMWGFYCLNAHRLIGVKSALTVQKIKPILYIAIYVLAFSIVKDEIPLSVFSFFLLGLALMIHHSFRDFMYIAYFLLMGVIVETSGVLNGLWLYPQASYFAWPLWAPLMWANIGLIMSQVSVWFFAE